MALPPLLRTERLELRPFSCLDAPRVQALAGDREVASTTLVIPHPYEDGMAEAWIETLEPGFNEGTIATFAITTAPDGLIGAIGLRIRPEHRHAELGYWVGRPYWGRGFVTEAAREVLRYAFEDLHLHRVNAHYLLRNPASGRVMEKIGMSREGIFREHILKWGRYEDIEFFGILRRDWEARHDAGSTPR